MCRLRLIAFYGIFDIMCFLSSDWSRETQQEVAVCELPPDVSHRRIQKWTRTASTRPHENESETGPAASHHPQPAVGRTTEN